MQSPEGPKKDNSVDNLMVFIRHNKWDALAYLVLFFGLVYSIFERFTGGLVVGCILGIYFSAELKEKFTSFKEYLANEGMFRGFVIVAAFIALLIASPGLCIGAVFGAFLRPLFGNLISGPFEPPTNRE